TARVVSTLMMLLYGVFIVGEGLPAIGSQPGGVRLGFIALAVCFTGFFIGWRREGWGALVIAIGWGLWQVSEAVFKLSLFQVPLLVAALYGFYWWITAGRRTWVLAGATCALALGIALGLLLVPANVFLSGAVLDGATGEPVPGAEFVLGATAPSPGRRPAARSGPDGKYRLYIGWYSPQQAVSISAPGFETRESVLGSRLLGQRRIARDYRLKRAVASVPSAEFRETPPVVIKTFPESGISGVDPALSELRVTFSKPMQAGFWSWCPEHESTAPAICGDPKYLADERTCVLPVRLAGGKTYAVWLNTESNHLFRDQNGNVAVPYLLIFETRKNL
ncbi:MAG TPA: hypothetical protein VN673_02995, partial [Clostridia bacterium]|nr:hypothetical protein [Clostridia bacterium]